jgi:hypothetical protein
MFYLQTPDMNKLNNFDEEKIINEKEKDRSDFWHNLNHNPDIRTGIYYKRSMETEDGPLCYPVYDKVA